jgi:hypothetical protein
MNFSLIDDKFLNTKYNHFIRISVGLLKTIFWDEETVIESLLW